MPAIKTARQSIQQLPLLLANQIAAGEVVERPASVVKELLENSLDAGASQIEIDIQAGGTQSIRVRDNGFGIPKDELPLALRSHATSKIHSMDDLIHISSMGFRGEALASIASVSELTLTSKFNEMAWHIKSKEGQIELIPASHPFGTTVEVNNLFYNTPARRKFLRGDRTEYRHVEDVVKRIALARFDVAINFRHNQRQIFSLGVAKTDENKIQRLTRLINSEFIQAAVKLGFENADLKLWGWLASPVYSRSQSDMQYFFVNGRIIRDKVITHAVRQAFEDNLLPGRFPVYVLHLEMNAEQVDVNVHPTKHEVRFRQARLIHDFLFFSLRQALTPENETKEKKSEISFIQTNNYSSGHSPFKGAQLNKTQFNKIHLNKKHLIKKHQGAYRGSFAADIYSSVAESNVANHDDLNKPLGIAISKLDNKYLIAQNHDGLLVVKLEQARKLLVAGKIKTSLLDQKKLISKPVLIPFSININKDANAWLACHKNDLHILGFEFALLGEKEIMVRQVPAMLNTTNLKESISQFIKNISNNNDNNFSTMSAALVEVVSNEDFSNNPADWNQLLRELEQHGLEELDQTQNNQPQVLYHQISESELASWFKN